MGAPSAGTQRLASSWAPASAVLTVQDFEVPFVALPLPPSQGYRRRSCWIGGGMAACRARAGDAGRRRPLSHRCGRRVPRRFERGISRRFTAACAPSVTSRTEYHHRARLRGGCTWSSGRACEFARCRFVAL